MNAKEAAEKIVFLIMSKGKLEVAENGSEEVVQIIQQCVTDAVMEVLDKVGENEDRRFEFEQRTRALHKDWKEFKKELGR